jgi:hypothetical protein
MRVYVLRGDGNLMPHFGGAFSTYASFDFGEGLGSSLAGLATKPGHASGVYVYGSLARYPADGGDRTVVLALDGNGVADSAFGPSGNGMVFLEPPFIADRAAPQADGISVSGNRLILLESYRGGWYQLMQYYDAFVTRLER